MGLAPSVCRRTSTGQSSYRMGRFDSCKLGCRNKRLGCLVPRTDSHHHDRALDAAAGTPIAAASERLVTRNSVVQCRRMKRVPPSRRHKADLRARAHRCAAYRTSHCIPASSRPRSWALPPYSASSPLSSPSSHMLQSSTAQSQRPAFSTDITSPTVIRAKRKSGLVSPYF